MSSREIIVKGARWNVGDGSNIRIWDDLWVVGHNERLTRPNQCELNLVRDLMRTDFSGWNEEVVRNMFDNLLAEKILSMFCTKEGKDVLYWNGTTIGDFSVKSACYLAMEGLVHPPSRLVAVNNSVWRTIWHASVPAKMKFFAWRVICNCIPTGANFAKRGLLLDNCDSVHCECMYEDIHHTLFSCPYATQLWSRATSTWTTIFTTDSSVIDIFSSMSTAGHEVFATFLMLCRSLWSARNYKFHGNDELQPENLYHRTKVILYEFWQANVKVQAEVNMDGNQVSRWRPPSSGIIKVNTDAAWLRMNNIARLGFVCRNSNGEVLMVGSKSHTTVASIIEAEARSVLFALESSIERGFGTLVVEMDSLLLFRALIENTNIGSISNVLSAIRRLSTMITGCSWSFIRRCGNGVAHNLAAWAIRERPHLLVTANVPSIIEEAVGSNLALL